MSDFNFQESENHKSKFETEKQKLLDQFQKLKSELEKKIKETNDQKDVDQLNQIKHLIQLTLNHTKEQYDNIDFIFGRRSNSDDQFIKN